MSISVKQLKKILGSFSTAVAKDVSGIKTEYATKKDVEGFAKISDLNNTYIRKGDIHTEDYVTNVIFRDAYQNRLVKKTDLPALDTIATKQEISDAVSAVHVPSIEGLAKESEVDTKLADYAKTAEVAKTYATKEAVNAINGLDADTIATLKNLSEHSDLTTIANKVDNVYTKAETDDKLATKADVSAIPSVEGLAKVTDVETTYAKKSELPDVSGLATKQEVTEAIAGVQVPSIEGLAKVTDVDVKLATKADMSAIPDISNLATKEEVSAINNKLAAKADASAIPSIEGLAKTTEVEATYAKKSELPSVEGLATKTEVTEAVAGLAKASEVAETYATKEAVNAVAGLDADTVSTLKTLAQNSDLATVAEKVKNVYTKTETDDKLATKADVTAIPDVSGLATKQEVKAAVAGITVPSIEGLAKTTDIETAYAKKTELPDVSSLATKTEVEALKTNFVTEETLIQNINQFFTNIDGKINEAKGELEAKVTVVDGKLADYAKKTELPNVSTLATKQEVTDAVTAIHIPSIEGLATKANVEATYVKKSQLSDGSLNFATKSEVGAIEGRLSDFVTKSDIQTSLVIKQELNDYLRKADVSDVSVTKEAYDAKVQELETEISTLKSKLAVAATIQSGTTEQRPTENLVVGQTFFDTTLGVPVFWNGTEWHNPFAKITTVEVENH